MALAFSLGLEQLVFDRDLHPIVHSTQAGIKLHQLLRQLAGSLIEDLMTGALRPCPQVYAAQHCADI